MLGNVASSANRWREATDTSAPRMVITAAATGLSYFDTASNQALNAIRYLCAAQGRYLNETFFTCPGKGLAAVVRSFDFLV